MTVRHVVLFSGGLGSYFAAKRVVAEHGASNCTLLFCDTCMEDEDLYRFVDQAQRQLGAKLVRLADGRTPWDVFADVRFLGNSRIDPCSRILKREQSAAWLNANCDPKATVVYLGIDWTEEHRFERVRRRKSAWTYQAPLCDAPYLSAADKAAELRADGIAAPRLYGLGFTHNNCGGWCVKAGQAHFANLLRTMPDRYIFHENKEQQLRDTLQKDVTILTDRQGGERRPLTLRDFRHRLEKQPELPAETKFDWGGCGCFAGEQET